MIKQIMSRLPRFLIPVATTLLGFVIGLLLFYIMTFIQQRGNWEQLDTPPGDIDQLAAANQNYVIVRTADNAFYKLYCRAKKPDDVCWQEVEPPPEATQLPCDDDFRSPPAPGPVQDHIEDCIYFEYISLTQYALLEDGTLWRWGVVINPLGQVFNLVWTVIISSSLGALVGVIALVNSYLG